VFSKASYDEGGVVYMSPVLVLPKHLIRKYEDTNVLINYCISAEGSDAALLPIGLTAMLNHGGARSNVRMEWYTGEGDQSNLALPIKDLEALPFAPLDIRYVATRPIGRSEELLLDYGDAWATKWVQHLDRLIEWNGDIDWTEESRENTESPSIALKPQFREPIGVPDGFFPAHFQSECIGSEALCGNYVSFAEVKRKKSELYGLSKQTLREML
jgi:hypothetical protein